MADEVRGSVTGGNGERLELRIGSKSLGLTTRDLIPILLLVMMGVGGYLLYTNVYSGLVRLEHSHSEVDQTLHEIDQRLHNNELKILEAIQIWRDLIEGQTESIITSCRRMLQIHEYNQDRASGDRIPLEGAPEHVPKHDKGP